MIRVVCRREGGWDLRLSGHAGTAPYGEDLVCAAVTALVCALAKYVSQQEPTAHIHLQPGDAHIKAKGENLEPAFQTVLAGLKLLEKDYPEGVGVSYEL